MGKKNKASKKKSNKSGGKSTAATTTSTSGGGDSNLIWVDPARVRFQHSRIRPYFSGCGRSVVGTLESIRKNEITPSDLPPIQVIAGPETDNGPWYFSLNNRRLWVLKRCREEGLLSNSSNKILVRVREPKSAAEAARYTLQNCALEAKFVKEKDPRRPPTSSSTTSASDQKAAATTSTSREEEEVQGERSSTTKVGTEIREEKVQSSTIIRRQSLQQNNSNEEDDGSSEEEEDDSDSDYSDADANTNRFSSLLL